jgi:hypothetical protein
MKHSAIFALLAALALCEGTQESIAANKAHVIAKELPPEAIPQGACRSSESGYITMDHRQTGLSFQEIGAYVADQLKSGYSLELYPQQSGRIFVIATCHKTMAEDGSPRP